MNQTLEQVKEFHETFKHPIGNLTELEPLEVRQLRIRLLFEELAELAEASDCPSTMTMLCGLYTVKKMPKESRERAWNSLSEEIIRKYDIKDGDNVNKLEELDALADIQYVLNGKILTAGLHNCFDGNFNCVHYNNMGKLHRDMLHVNETVKQKELKFEGVTTEAVEGGVILKDNGKVIKPWDFEKVELRLY